MDKIGTLPFSWDSLELNDQFFHTLCNHDRLGEIRRSFGLGQRNNSVKKRNETYFVDLTKKSLAAHLQHAHVSLERNLGAWNSKKFSSSDECTLDV